MQKDMHYYGIYSLARAAGMKDDAAQIVASASQFVDDSVEYDLVFLPDGGSISCTVTAHHTESTKNLDITDQRYIWVPFHFLPAGSGSTMQEKLVCGENSALAQEMVQNALNESIDGLNALTRIGITAHVYADTFSHYGFAGISSPLNKVITDSIDFEIKSAGVKKYIIRKTKKFMKTNQIIPSLKSRFQQFFDRLTGTFAESVSHALGHGPVATCPDRPFLKWSFQYEESGKNEKRNNMQTFKNGCTNIHQMFRTFLAKNPAYKDGDGVEFASISQSVEEILGFEGTEDERSGKWEDYVKKGNLFPNASGNGIPSYRGTVWEKANSKNKDCSSASKKDIEEAVAFHKSAEDHQHYVLKKLLPKYGINIV